MSQETVIWIMIITIWILIAIAVSGCVLYRHDTEPQRESATFWTLFKDFDIIVDPNGLSYKSSSNKVSILTPYGTGKTR